MDLSDLAALVPGLMQGHPAVAWTLAHEPSDEDDLVLMLHPLAWPDRVATVTVYAGGEVFCCEFAGHVSTDLAYADVDRPVVLKDRIELAVAATTGPSRVVIDRIGDDIVRSAMIIDPDGQAREDGVVSYPVRKVRGNVRRQPASREIREFPAG